MFEAVLVANRGEIAVRIIRTLRRLGIRSVAVYTDAELAGAPPRHVRDADVAVRLPGGYLDAEAIVEAALRTGAGAIHPGYGFLAENAAFARRCAEAGVVFVGPPPEAIEAMGDKIQAKATVAAAGVPVLPGGAEPGDDLAAAAERIGFPVLVKPSAGGGGKGMLLVRSAAELPEALESARRTALAAFGDGTLMIERYVPDPRHIEIQVLADAHGHVVHLGERECSLQRRHQKIVEEAPSPLLDEATRARMGAAAVEAARSAGYVGAGTVEFIAHAAGGTVEYFFLEMNTRLQVEHPVTEAVTGIDLVEAQLRVAAGEPLWFTQDQVRLSGHAIEARVYAEDPARGFLPTGGTVLRLREPDLPGVRVDSGLLPGTVVGTGFDPMLAKVIAHGPDRAEALRRLDTALARTVLLGVPTNIAFLRSLLADPAVVAGELDTGLVERHVPAPPPRDQALAAAALLLHDRPVGPDPWDVPDGWRIGERAWTRYRLRDGDGTTEVRVRGLAAAAEIAVGDDVAVPGRVIDRGGPDGELVAELGGAARRYACARDGDVVWLGAEGAAWRFELAGERRERAASRAGGGAVRSPMPGTVLLVKVAPGERVARGQPLVIVEAMKMEHVVAAPLDGVVAELPVRAGQSVEMDALLAVVKPEEGD